MRRRFLSRCILWSKPKKYQIVAPPKSKIKTRITAITVMFLRHRCRRVRRSVHSDPTMRLFAVQHNFYHFLHSRIVGPALAPASLALSPWLAKDRLYFGSSAYLDPSANPEPSSRFGIVAINIFSQGFVAPSGLSFALLASMDARLAPIQGGGST